MRFSVYESIREFAAEKLAASGGEGAARDRHAAHYLEAADAWRKRAAGPAARSKA